VPHDPEGEGENGPAGRVVASGPGDATAAGDAERADAEVEAAKNARFISAFCPEDIPGADQSAACLEVAALQNQLEEIEKSTKRSMAAEVESAIEGGACLVDEAGRDRILQLCRDVRSTAAKLSGAERLQKLQAELQRAAVGTQRASVSQASEGLDPPQPEGSSAPSRTLPELACPTDRTPLSFGTGKSGLRRDQLSGATGMQATLIPSAPTHRYLPTNGSRPCELLTIVHLIGTPMRTVNPSGCHSRRIGGRPPYGWPADGESRPMVSDPIQTH